MRDFYVYFDLLWSFTMFPNEYALFGHNKVVENIHSDAEPLKYAALASFFWSQHHHHKG